MPHDPFIGQTIDEKIRIDSLLGSGGMGSVYKAWHSGFEKWVAVKILSAAESGDAAGLARFKREAATLSELNHPNILRIYSFGITSGAIVAPYLVLEYLADGSLQDVLTERTSVTTREGIKILLDAAKALAAANEKNLVHRDIKPSNIMFAGQEAKLVDFGVAKSILPDSSQKLTQTGAIIGTPRYMSPEQIAGQKLGPESDIYSLGTVIYEAMFAKPYLTGENIFELALNQLSADTTIPNATAGGDPVPASVQLLLSRMLVNDRAQRIADGNALKGLVTLISDTPSVVPNELKKFEHSSSTTAKSNKTKSNTLTGALSDYSKNKSSSSSQIALKPLIRLALMVVAVSGVALVAFNLVSNQGLDKERAFAQLDETARAATKWDPNNDKQYARLREELERATPLLQDPKYKLRVRTLLRDVAVHRINRKFPLGDDAREVLRQIGELQLQGSADVDLNCGIYAMIAFAEIQNMALSSLHNSPAGVEYWRALAEKDSVNSYKQLSRLSFYEQEGLEDDRRLTTQEKVDGTIGLTKALIGVGNQGYCKALAVSDRAERRKQMLNARDLCAKATDLIYRFPQIRTDKFTHTDVAELIDTMRGSLREIGDAEAKHELERFNYNISKGPTAPFWRRGF